MGFSLLNYYFRGDPFETNFKFLILNGFWPLDTKSKTVQNLYAVYSFICYFSPTSMLFIQLIDLYLLRNDPFTFTKNLCASLITCASVVKHFTIFYKIEKVQVLHKILKEFKESRTDPDDLIIVKNADRVMSQTTKAIYSLAVPCIFAWMLYPGLESGNQKKVPFPYRLPTDDWSTPIYEILYTYQSLSMVGFMVIILSNDLVYYGLVIRINAEYDILIRKFGTLKAIVESNLNKREVTEIPTRERYDPIVTERVKMLVRECSIFHQNILEKIGQLKLIYGKSYMIHFIAAVILIGTIIIDVVVVSKGFKLQMLQRIMYSMNGVFDTFVCCYFTTQMQEKSYELRRAVYATPWYELNPKIRKDLLMITIRTIKAPVLKVGNYFPLNLSTFLQFLKLSYNITALLYQTIKK